MSHEATAWAFKQKGLDPAEFRVLINLADCHNPSRGCFPSQEYLAEACEITDRSVRKHLKSLEDKALIRRERITSSTGQCGGTRYYFAYEDAQPEKFSGRTPTGKTAQNQPEKLGKPTGSCVPPITGKITCKNNIPPKSPFSRQGRKVDDTPKPPDPKTFTLGKWMAIRNLRDERERWTEHWGPPEGAEGSFFPTELLKLRDQVEKAKGHDFARSYLHEAIPRKDGSLTVATMVAYERLNALNLGIRLSVLVHDEAPGVKLASSHSAARGR